MTKIKKEKNDKGISKEQLNRIISKIKEEGKAREERYREKYSPKNKYLTERISEGKRLRKESIPEYKKNIKIAKRYSKGSIDELKNKRALSNLKLRGILQNLKEDKTLNKKEKQITKKAYKEVYSDRKKKIGSMIKIEKDLEKARIKRQKELLPSVSGYKQQLAKERLKYGAKKVASRIETGITIGLEKSTQAIRKKLRDKVVSRKILKSGQMSVKIPEYKAPSVLGDPNRFFKDEMEETKRSMFL